MIDLLKNMVMQQIASKIGGDASNAIAEQGAGAFISMIKEKISGGGIGDITALLSGTGGDAGGLVAGFQEKLGSIMQEQGVPSEEATAQAGAVAPEIFNTVKEKFQSNDPENNAFDLSALAGLVGGADGMMGGAADLLKANAGDILGKAKNLF